MLSSRVHMWMKIARALTSPHTAALTPDELQRVELLVNEQILRGSAVTATEMPVDEAKKLGAMALFGEKYGDVVRVVRMGDFSAELCGGTHVNDTAKVGLFKILSESSVASGVRRIEAVTGLNTLGLLHAQENRLLCRARRAQSQQCGRAGQEGRVAAK